MISIKITKNILSRSFEVKHEGKTYYINYLNSDGQILGLSNRDYWEVTDEEFEEVCIYEFQETTKREKEQIKSNRKLVNKLIKFCIKHFNDYKLRVDIIS